VFEFSGKLCMKYSCKCHKQHGYECPHVFAVSGDEPPNADDIAIRWHKVYYASYLNGNPELDRVFDDLVENELPGAALPTNTAESF